jgi:demethylmenaquinone methyltransferase/2-methoxy-6-polyprenyl-1,4-benzoquinol methylase
LYRFYFTRVLPRIAGLFARRSAYDYLPDSVQDFPSPEAFAAMMRDAGCACVEHRPLTFGIVTLYIGTR